MFNIGDYVVYKREVCKIIDIKKNYIKDRDYYCMNNISDESLIINLPVDNKLIRPIITKDEAFELIDKIINIDIKFTNDKMIENEYKQLMKSDKLEDLIKIIKMTYKRCEERLKNGKKVSEKDDNYFKKAEDIFYSEMALALNMSKMEVKEYIINYIREKEI